MENANVTNPPRGWPLFLAGVFVMLLGPVVYTVQFQMAHLSVPWYVPILGTLGVMLMILSLVRRMSILRSIGLVFFVLVCAFQWFMLVVITKIPLYDGPAQPGIPLPEFTVKRADGSQFSKSDLKDHKATILLFFRGHW